MIELFNIGALILDEIQLIEFEGSRESTFESLLTIENNTKVALIVLGTEDSYKKMFPNLRMARRVGAIIEASQYCGSRQFFSHICNQLFAYQWFDKPVVLTEDIIDTLYSLSYGIIDQLISLYSFMNFVAIRSREPIEVNSKFIEDVSEQYYPGLQKLIMELKNNQRSIAEFEAQRKALCAKADSKAAAQMAELETQENISTILQEEETAVSRNYDQIFRNVIQNIKTLLEMSGEVYTDEKIEKAVKHVTSLKGNKNADLKSLTQQAYQWLKKGKSDLRPKSKKPVMDAEHIAIKNMIEKPAV